MNADKFSDHWFDGNTFTNNFSKKRDKDLNRNWLI